MSGDASPRAHREPDPARLRAGHGAKWTAVDADVIPAWVADMDLGVPEPVTARMLDTIARQDLGYPHWPGGDPVVTAFEDRMRTRYGWDPRGGRTRVFSDLIQILQVVIEQATAPGDVIALHVPSYPPFLAAIHRAGRRILPLPLDRADDRWVLDLDRHRELFAEHRPRLFVLVNPHNPTGRSWRHEELQALGDLAVHHGLPVLADEIHADLTYAPHQHVPFASTSPEAAALTITATSATKTFNLAGMRCAVAHVGHTPTADALDAAPLDYFGTPSVLSRTATAAAWRDSAAWHDCLMGRLTANRARVSAWVSDRPQLRWTPPEATYLAWIDFGHTTVARAPAAALLSTARVQLSDGSDFTQHTPVDCASYARLNFATTPAVLDTILDRIGSVIDDPGQ